MQTTSAARRLLARAALTLAAVFGLTGQAHAVDGCKVLLCLAGNWRNITVCVPPVRQAMHDAALGRGWPSCSLTSDAHGGTAEAHSTSTNEATCPPFAAEYSSESGRYMGCRYTGVVTTSVNGQLWSTLYWNAAADSLTSYSDAAKTQLGAGNYDTEYDTLLASWEASHPPGPPEDECVRHTGVPGCVER